MWPKCDKLFSITFDAALHCLQNHGDMNPLEVKYYDISAQEHYQDEKIP